MPNYVVLTVLLLIYINMNVWIFNFSMYRNTLKLANSFVGKGESEKKGGYQFNYGKMINEYIENFKAIDCCACVPCQWYNVAKLKSLDLSNYRQMVVILIHKNINVRQCGIPDWIPLLGCFCSTIPCMHHILWFFSHIPITSVEIINIIISFSLLETNSFYFSLIRLLATK